MNKILIDNLNLKDEEINLNVKKDIIINISGHVIIKEINNNNSNIVYTINLDYDSTLDYYRFDNKSNNLQIIINSNNNSICNYYSSVVATTKKEINIINNINGSSINNKIIVRGVTSKKGELLITANALVKEHTTNNIFNEDIRILTLNNCESRINPDLEINANDIVATHNAIISGINKNYLLYLASKGISKTNAKALIKKGFILNNISCLENYIKL